MNRRDFLKVGFAGLIGAMFPKLGAERLGIDMPIGDVLAKLAGGQQLNSGEIEQVRLWGNRQELQNAFVAGLQTGASDINAGTVRAEHGDFSRGVLSVSELYSTDLDGSDFLTFTTGTNINPLSPVQWSSAAPTKFTLSDYDISKGFLICGQVGLTSDTASQMDLKWYDSGDGLLETESLYQYTQSVSPSFSSVIPFPNHRASLTGVAYFKLIMSIGSASYSGANIWILHVL